jgi:hypothetical protein
MKDNVVLASHAEHPLVQVFKGIDNLEDLMADLVQAPG